MKAITIILLSFMVATQISYGQHHLSLSAGKKESKPFVLGVVDKIESAQLLETRVLNIYLPEEYDTDTAASYPVVYLLDGSANEDFIHIVGLVQFLSMIEFMPHSIVVGIANVDRKRDFTHPASFEDDKKLLPTSGGSKKFISFIEKELQPYIEHKYRTSDQKTIIGQSLGGLLVSEILLKKPVLFNNYMIISPSLWWDNESMLKEAPELLKSLPDNDINVYISVGNEEKQMQDDAEKLAGILRQTNKHLKVHYNPMPEENHLTILHNSAYRGFEVLHP